MSHLSVQLTVDRHRGGNTRIHGRVGESRQDVNVWKGPQPGDCYLEGEIEGAPTTLRINSAFADNGHKVFGRLAGVPFQGLWQQDSAEGDAHLQLDGARLSIDVDPTGTRIDSKGTRLQSTSEKVAQDGDERLKLTSDGQRLSLQVDRKPNGDFEVRGKDGDGPFRFSMKRKGQDGDLYVQGSMPENLRFLPLMWELYGNDAIETPEKPLSVGAAATLSAFWSNAIG